MMVVLTGAAALAVSAAERAPNFRLEGVDGQTYELKQAAQEARVVVVDFWDSGCKPCKQYMPHLQTFYEVYRPAGLALLVVARDTALTVSKVKPMVAAEKWTFPVLYDTDQKVSQAYHVKVSPVTFVISCNGEILYQHTGYKPGQEKELEAAIVKALGLSEEDVARLYAQRESAAEEAAAATAGTESAEEAEAAAPEGEGAEETAVGDDAGETDAQQPTGEAGRAGGEPLPCRDS